MAEMDEIAGQVPQRDDQRRNEGDEGQLKDNKPAMGKSTGNAVANRKETKESSQLCRIHQWQRKQGQKLQWAPG